MLNIESSNALMPLATARAPPPLFMNLCYPSVDADVDNKSVAICTSFSKVLEPVQQQTKHVFTITT